MDECLKPFIEFFLIDTSKRYGYIPNVDTMYIIFMEWSKWKKLILINFDKFENLYEQHFHYITNSISDDLLDSSIILTEENFSEKSQNKPIIKIKHYK